jgi:SAM-dependent methyltransferase
MTEPDEVGLTPEAAQGYEAFFVPAIFHQWPPVLMAEADIRPTDHVLDVGCGTGVLTRELLKVVGPQGSVTAIDLSESMLSVARTVCIGANCHLGNAANLPFDDNQFDAVFPSLDEFVRIEIQAWLLAGSVDDESLHRITALIRSNYPQYRDIEEPLEFSLNALVAKHIKAKQPMK